ncbi:hypothetical protein B0H14DRAFT_3629722, partial [Mycena olivaceomarginata]
YSLCEAELIAGVSITSDRKRQRAADDANRGPVREAREDLSYRYRREGRRFVKANPTPNGLENWGIACYQITHVEKHRSRWVDSLNHSRQGSAAVSDDGTDERIFRGHATRADLVPVVVGTRFVEICRSITVGVIKEEEEEDEDLGWRRREDQDITEEEEEEEEEDGEDGGPQGWHGSIPNSRRWPGIKLKGKNSGVKFKTPAPAQQLWQVSDAGIARSNRAGVMLNGGVEVFN